MNRWGQMMGNSDKWRILFFSMCCMLVSASYAAEDEGGSATGVREQLALAGSGDQALAARVEATIRAEPALRNAVNLAVTTSDGQVTLAGSVENAAQAERAVEVARGVKGVKGVQEKLVRESDIGVPATLHQSTTIDGGVGAMSTDPEATMNWDEINRLLRSELSAVETYQQALQKEGQKFEHEAEFQQLATILNDHQQAAARLEAQIKQMGGRPVQDSGAWGTWSKIVMGTAKFFGDKAALKALKEGEESGLKEYQEVLNDTATPGEVKPLINSLLAQQHSHIQALDGLLARL